MCMKVLKNAVIMLVVVAGFTACDKPEQVYGGDGEFCSCFNLDDINKTIPAVNEFLAGLPDDVRLIYAGDESNEQIFKSLEGWFNSFDCNIYATVTYGIDITNGGMKAASVSILVKENEAVRELNVNFDFTKTYPYSQITGYYYFKQDAIYVSTTFTKISQGFDFINSLDLDVQSINYGSYRSSMPADSANLEYIENSLKAKPYIRSVLVSDFMGYFNPPEINVYVHALYDMHNKEYQADWLDTMQDCKLVEKGGSPVTIIFDIPEGAGKQWEKQFKKYDLVREAFPYDTRYDITLINQ